MFQKKRFFENKKIRVRFSIVDFPAKPAKQKKQVALKKSLRLHSRGAPAAAAERLYKFLEKNIFFSKFLIWPSGLPRPTSSKITARWRYRLPSNNLTAHYNKNASKRLWIGPKHNSVHFKSLCWCLPIDRWSRVHPVYAGKRL